MKFFITVIFTVLIPGFNHTVVPDKVFRQLYALEGKWIMKKGKGSIGEEWVKINEGHLQGKGFFVKGIDTIVTENISLTFSAGSISYTSTVEDQNNRQQVSFKLSSSKDGVFIFENPTHDFPKRIIYEIISADSLHAYIDGGAASGKRNDFYYHKVKQRSS